MRVLYIGGTGEISRACVDRSVAFGHDVTVFNRGRQADDLPGVTRVVGDVRDEDALQALAAQNYDVVCQFLAFDTDAVQRDIRHFGGRCGQYLFIGTASSYRKPHGGVVTEATPLGNRYWLYSRKKADCEAVLRQAHAAGALPVTIVRPSHTYRTRLPSTVVDGLHLAWRLQRHQPVVVHDEGASRWTLTHADDFANAFVRLFGVAASLGEAFSYHQRRKHQPGVRYYSRLPSAWVFSQTFAAFRLRSWCARIRIGKGRFWVTNPTIRGSTTATCET